MRVAIFVEHLATRCSDPRRDFINLLSRRRMKGEMVETYSLSVVAKRGVFYLGLNEDDVRASQHEA